LNIKVMKDYINNKRLALQIGIPLVIILSSFAFKSGFLKNGTSVLHNQYYLIILELSICALFVSFAFNIGSLFNFKI
jgi:hypothetical protein